ncbi:MAG: putative O-glycosylation ligase, exosortase A system-associated [Magnetospiraceae bacterium]
MRSLLVLLIAMSAVFSTLILPHLGILTWFWISILNPHRLTWGIAQTFQTAMMVALATVVSFAISKESKKLPWNGVTIILLVFFGWTLFTSIFAQAPAPAVAKLILVAKIVVMNFVAIILINSRERIHALLWILVLSLCYFGVKGGIFTILSGGNYMVFGPERSFIGANNALGMALTMAIPIILYMASVSRLNYIRWGLWFSALLCAASVVSTHSRGAFLALAAMGLVLITRSKRKALMLIVAAAAAVGGFFFMPDSYWERIGTIDNYDEDRSAMGRIIMWEFAIDVAVDRPIQGGGFNVFDARHLWSKYGLAAEDARAVHSIYFEVLGEHGFVGLALYLTMGLVGLVYAGRLRRVHVRDPNDAWVNDLGGAIQVALVGFAVGGAFLNKAYFDFYLILLAVLASSYNVMVKRGYFASARSRRIAQRQAAKEEMVGVQSARKVSR